MINAGGFLLFIHLHFTSHKLGCGRFPDICRRNFKFAGERTVIVGEILLLWANAQSLWAIARKFRKDHFK